MASGLDAAPRQRGGSPIDHLTCPNDPTHEHEEVPYACSDVPYDNGPFLEYDRREGWSADAIKDPKGSGRSEEEIACFFQNWFFFGLLADTLGASFLADDFVVPGREQPKGEQRNGEQRKVLTTRKLVSLMLQWYDEMQTLSLDSLRKHATRIDANLWRVCNIMSDWGLDQKSPLNQ